MDDLVQWLRAQLDKDREIAIAAKRQIGDDWDIGDEPYGFILSDGDTVAYYEEAGGHSAMCRAAAVHAAEHDPARVLREIDTKRRMIDTFTSRYEASNASSTSTATGAHWVMLADTLRLLALPYAGRPGYRAEWRP
ncbi:DUF6221 family protein [Streptomyces sp. NBC_00444]|uniref:DUF6221 family protein n=1 Tax=Streptomyces sp. NBC_00444 TaxID=2975744 RepID=UPI002E1B5CD7